LTSFDRGGVRTIAVAIALLALTAAAPPATAQIGPEGDARTQAQAHLSRGNDLFTIDKFRDALTEFQAAFAAFPSPKLHFNIGQCQRALGNQPEALAEFQRFVDEAQDVSPELRREAENYIVELKTATNRAPPPPTTVVAAPIAPVLIPPPPSAITPAAPLIDAAPPAAANIDNERPLYKRWWFWATVGVIAAGAAVGVVFLTRPRDPACTENCF
jgi:tetratricopeptide (TPR) repeat protein